MVQSQTRTKIRYHEKKDRQALAKVGVVFSALDLWSAQVFKPEASWQVTLVEDSLLTYLLPI